MADLTFHEEEAISEALSELRRNDSDMNWVLFGYRTKTCLEMLGAGEGGLEELKDELKPDEIRFAILEVVVTGDEYNAVKFVLITWVGPDVKAGARAVVRCVCVLCSSYVRLVCAYVSHCFLCLNGAYFGAGLAKARCAGHRKELVTFVQQSIGIAAEYQPATLEEITSADISSKITRVAASYQDSVSVGAFERARNKRQVCTLLMQNQASRRRIAR